MLTYYYYLEKQHIPGTHAASLAADSPLKLRPETKEIQLNQQGEWTKYESSKVKSCWGIQVRADVPYATVLLRFYHKTKIEKSANSFFFLLLKFKLTKKYMSINSFAFLLRC